MAAIRGERSLTSWSRDEVKLVKPVGNPIEKRQIDGSGHHYNHSSST